MNANDLLRRAVEELMALDQQVDQEFGLPGDPPSSASRLIEEIEAYLAGATHQEIY